MTGLSKITDKILNEAREDAKATLARADAECAAVTEEYRRRADAIRESVHDQARTEAEETVLRAKSSVETLRRDRMLQAKIDQIDRAFQLAKKEFLDLSAEEYLSFLTSLLVATVKQQAQDEELGRSLYGEEDAPPEVEQYEVLLNRRDAGHYGEDMMRAAKQRLADGPYASIVSKLILSSEDANVEGGLILRCGKVELNYSLDALFAQVRPQLEAKVGQKLFPEQ